MSELKFAIALPFLIAALVPVHGVPTSETLPGESAPEPSLNSTKEFGVLTPANFCDEDGGESQFFITAFLKANRFNALRFCAFYGMSLASVESASIYASLKLQLNQIGNSPNLDRDYWLGGTNLGQSPPNYFWIRTGLTINFSDWAPGEPNNSGGIENCLELARRNNGTKFFWNDNDCMKENYIICQRSCPCSNIDDEWKKTNE